jgi:DUF1680 family protein
MGHAVRANYLYAGVADVYAETGDAGFDRTAAHVMWDDVTQHKMYVTGGCGSLIRRGVTGWYFLQAG